MQRLNSLFNIEMEYGEHETTKELTEESTIFLVRLPMKRIYNSMLSEKD